MLQCLKCSLSFEVTFKIQHCPTCDSDMIVELGKVTNNNTR